MTIYTREKCLCTKRILPNPNPTLWPNKAIYTPKQKPRHIHLFCAFFQGKSNVPHDKLLESSRCRIRPLENSGYRPRLTHWWYKSKIYFSSEFEVQITQKRGSRAQIPHPRKLFEIPHTTKIFGRNPTAKPNQKMCIWHLFFACQREILAIQPKIRSWT